MLKGTIQRPAGAKEPIIRIVGDAETYLIEGSEAIEVPRTPEGWQDILRGMFFECRDTPLRRAGGELIDG
ncbi:MAG: hypothetical protein OXL96_13975 [Candidatus Poribacteria bacterium]|nr:hypothetical protein [Candidatus Poribacteria bacterium]